MSAESCVSSGPNLLNEQEFLAAAESVSLLSPDALLTEASTPLTQLTSTAERGRWQRARPVLRRLAQTALTLSLATGGVAAVGAMAPTSARANTITYSSLEYPYASEPCEHYPYTDSGGEDYCSDYDWGPTPDTTSGWTEADSYDPNYGGYGYRNCTDFVAWKIDSLGGDVPSDLGDGGSWYDNAPPSERSTTPQAGDAAVSPSHDHVAYVESVNGDGTITVEEYNYDEAGDGDTQTGTPASMGFTEYVDFGVNPNGGALSPSPYKPNYLAAATNANGEIELFGVGIDNEVYWTHQTAPNTDSWTDWGEINAGADSIAVGVNANGGLDEFTVGPDGKVYYRYEETPGDNDWSDEQSIDADVAGPISAATNSDGTIELYAVGTDQDVYWTRQTADNTQSWDDWGKINAGANSSAATNNEDGRLSEFIVGTNGSVYYRDQGTASVDSWGNEQSIDANLNGQIAAVTNTTDGSIELFATGTNGDIYWTRQSTPSTDTWNDWGEINAGATSLAAAVNEDGSVEEFTIGTDGKVYYRYQETPGEDDWSDEESIAADLMH